MADPRLGLQQDAFAAVCLRDREEQIRRRWYFLNGVELRGTIKIPKGAALNYVATSDAYGVVTWQSAASLSVGALADYWYKPGIAAAFTAYMRTTSAGVGYVSSTAHATKGKMHFGVSGAERMTIDESAGSVGINTTTPGATLHIVGNAAAGSVLVPTSTIGVNWDGPRNAASVLTGNSLYVGVAVNNDDTEWDGVNPASLGTNPQNFGMPTLTPGRVWTVTIRLRTDSGTANDAANSYSDFSIFDASGNQFTYAAGSGPSGRLSLSGLTTTWTTYTFTLDCTGAPVGSGTANSIRVGLLTTQSPAITLYTRCTYIALQSNAGDIARWDLNGGTQSGRISAEGYMGVNTGSNALSAWATVQASSTTDTVLNLLASGGSTIARFVGNTGGGGSAIFYPSGGSGVIIYRPNTSDISRIGIRQATPGASLDILSETGTAPCINIARASGGTGAGILAQGITGGTAGTALTLSSDGLTSITGYTGQASSTLFTIDGTLGNAASVLMKFTPNASQTGKIINFTPTAGVAPALDSGFNVQASGQVTMRPESAGSALLLQRNRTGTATSILGVLNNSSNYVMVVSPAGRLSLDPAGTTITSLSTTGIFNVTMNSMTVPAINSLFTIDAGAGATDGLWRFVPTITDTGVGGASVTCLRVAPTITGGGGQYKAIEAALTIPSDGSGAGTYQAMMFTIDLTSTTGTVSAIQGSAGSILDNGSSANVSTLYAINATANLNGTMTVGDFRCLNVAGNLNSGTFTTAYGIWLDVGGNADVNTTYGFYINDITTGSGSHPNRWCLYFVSDAPSWTQGFLKIGGTAAVAGAGLELPAGTATAGTAPLKFNSGTSLGTAVPGIMEMTTDDLFFTITTGTARKAFVLDDGARLTLGKVPKATTNGRLIDGSTYVGTPVVVGDDPPAVASGALGKVDLTAQTADIGSTNLTNSPSTGCYRLSCVLEDTTADVTAGTVTATFSWTDDSGAKTATVAQALIALGSAQLDQVIYIASGNLSYATTHTGIYGTSAYAIRIRVEALT